MSNGRGNSDGSKNICLNKFASAKMFTTANKRFSRIWQLYSTEFKNWQIFGMHLVKGMWCDTSIES